MLIHSFTDFISDRHEVGGVSDSLPVHFTSYNDPPSRDSATKYLISLSLSA